MSNAGSIVTLLLLATSAGALGGCSSSSETPSPSPSETESPTQGITPTPTSPPVETPTVSPTDTPAPAPTGTPVATPTAPPEPTPVPTPIAADYDSVVLRRTSYGVVHVTAVDYPGLGYGVGYAFTEDNRCLLAERIAQVNGRLAEQLGAEVLVHNAVHDTDMAALDSDRFYRGWFKGAQIREAFDAGAVEVRALAQGYADGVNAYVNAHPTLPPCPVDFKGPVVREDLYRMWVATATVGSGELLAPFMATEPPAAKQPAPSHKARVQPPQAPIAPAKALPKVPERLAGSNAWALGRDATQHSGSVHLYNPHFPWEGIQRLYLIHLTLPGELDVMGGTLGGFPVPLAGFNASMAWGLTFSTASRFTVAELPLVSGDPLRYTVDGKTRNIQATQISIPVLGETSPRQVTFYQSEVGPIIDAPAYLMGWSKRTAYAVHDVNANNTRFVEQFLSLAKASSVDEVEASLELHQGVPWSYTLASDAQGEVFFGDISAVPPVSSSDIEQCSTSATAKALLPLGIVVLDGGKSTCEWEGLMGPSEQPRTTRSDYVANSNNNFELPNVQERLEGFSPLFGTPNSPLALRPSLGLNMIESRIAGTDGLGSPGFTASLAQEVFFQRRNRAAELLATAIAADCLTRPNTTFNGTAVDLTALCTALSSWDQRNTLESQGAHLFRGFWMAYSDDNSTDDLFAVPATLDSPLDTPSGYSTDPTVRQAVLQALARVALALESKEIDVTAPWSTVNVVDTGTARYSVPGGAGREGIFDVLENAVGYYHFDGWLESLAGVPPDSLFGASYEHVVSFEGAGPVAWGLLTYSQATEPSSPYYLDQLEALSTDAWFQFPFAESDILTDPGLEVIALP